jgi:hypothetical protein
MKKNDLIQQKKFRKSSQEILRHIGYENPDDPNDRATREARRAEPGFRIHRRMMRKA